MAQIAFFAALTAVCSQILIPLPFTPVPINLATFAVFMAGGLLGAVKGGASQLIYVLLGAAGAPVFSNMEGGLGKLAGPTGGYIFGYILAALVIGLIINMITRRDDRLRSSTDGRGRPSLHRVSFVIAMTAGAVCYFTLGTAWFMVLTGRGLAESLTMCVWPYLPGDALKIALAAYLVKRLGKRFM